MIDVITDDELLACRPIAYKAAYQIKRTLPNLPEYDIEDLKGEAVMALVRCRDRWEPSKGLFKAFIMKHIYGALVDYVRRVAPLTRGQRRDGMKMPALVGIDAARKVPTLPTDITRGTLVHEVLAKLDAVPADKALLVRHFLEGQTLKAIGESCGVRESMACKKVQQAVRVARELVA